MIISGQGRGLGSSETSMAASRECERKDYIQPFSCKPENGLK
jgi:hypothetical protein